MLTIFNLLEICYRQSKTVHLQTKTSNLYSQKFIIIFIRLCYDISCCIQPMNFDHFNNKAIFKEYREACLQGFTHLCYLFRQLRDVLNYPSMVFKALTAVFRSNKKPDSKKIKLFLHEEVHPTLKVCVHFVLKKLLLVVLHNFICLVLLF